MSTTAPSCPISHSQQKISTSQQQTRAVDVASIPPARDLPSVITAINAINNVVQHITRGLPDVNNTYIPGIKWPDQQPPEKLDYLKLRWKEVKREYSDKQYIVNPDDKEQRINVKTITRIKWLEDNTEHQLVYMGHKGPIGPGRM